MKLALLFMLCLMATAFGQPQPEEGQPDDGNLSQEEGLEADGGPIDEGGSDDGEEEGGQGDYEDEEEEPADENGAEPADVKDKDAAGHFRGRERYGFRGGFRGHRRYRHRGGYGSRRRLHYREGHGSVDRSTCSVQASYFLSYNGDRRHCRFATDDHDDCQACCEAATRRETRGADKDDIIGFITLNVRHRGGEYRGKREAAAAYGSGDKGKDYKPIFPEPKWECVCCIPKANRS